MLLSVRAPHMLGDVSKYPELFATLLASGMWTLEDLKKLAGLNFVRVFQEVEKVGVTCQNKNSIVCTGWTNALVN